MISDKFLWGNVFFGGKLQIDAKNSEIFESTLYLKSVSMPLIILLIILNHNSVKMPMYILHAGCLAKCYMYPVHNVILLGLSCKCSTLVASAVLPVSL